MSFSLPYSSSIFLSNRERDRDTAQGITHSHTPSAPPPCPGCSLRSGPLQAIGQDLLRSSATQKVSDTSACPSRRVGVSVHPEVHTWIVALPHLFGGWLISVPRRGLIDGCLPPSDAGRESLGLIVCFGDAGGLERSRAGG